MEGQAPYACANGSNGLSVAQAKLSSSQELAETNSAEGGQTSTSQGNTGREPNKPSSQPLLAAKQGFSVLLHLITWTGSRARHGGCCWIHLKRCLSQHRTLLAGEACVEVAKSSHGHPNWLKILRMLGCTLQQPLELNPV